MILCRAWMRLPSLGEALGAIAHQRGRHLHEGRRLDGGDAVLHQQIGKLVLELGMIGAGDEVDAVGAPAGICVWMARIAFSIAGRRRPPAPKKPQEASLRHADDDVDGSNALIHAARQIGIADIEVGAERAGAEALLC